MSITLYSSPMKYKDPTTGNYVDLVGISGNPGRGIASVVLNNDYTLTITFTDNTSTTVGPIRGEPGEDYVLTEQDKEDIAALIDAPVQDVQVNGTSILGQDGIANVPTADTADFGVVKINTGNGIQVASDGALSIIPASNSNVKSGGTNYRSITPYNQHQSTFYGLAKAAGADMASSSNSVGTYTPEAKSSIQQMLGVSDLLAPSEPTLIASKAYSVGDVFTANGKLYKVTSAIAAAETIVVQNEGETISGHNAEECKVADYAVHDVQVNGTSILNNGVANVPIAGENNLGVVRVANSTHGLGVWGSGILHIETPTPNEIKVGNNTYKPISAGIQHTSTFYGLAKAAGDSTQSASSNPVGQYTDAAKSAIHEMLNGSVAVSGTTPAITALPGIRYICGEVATLDITLPASGIVDVVFTSGSTATVLTITPPIGVTVKWANGFVPTTLDANTTYEINIADGLGVAVGWT